MSFSVYGVEYSIRFTDKSKTVIASVKRLDRRLLSSQYYKLRNPYYMEHRFEKVWCEKISNPDFELYYDERARLNEILDIMNGYICEHGWYDVCYSINSCEDYV